MSEHEKKRRLAKEIEDFINEARLELNKEAGWELMKYPCKVEWIEDE